MVDRMGKAVNLALNGVTVTVDWKKVGQLMGEFAAQLERENAKRSAATLQEAPMVETVAGHMDCTDADVGKPGLAHVADLSTHELTQIRAKRKRELRIWDAIIDAAAG